jgi:hypothetical protein
MKPKEFWGVLGEELFLDHFRCCGMIRKKENYRWRNRWLVSL